MMETHNPAQHTSSYVVLHRMACYQRLPILFITILAHALIQASPIQSGPMVGYSEMREVPIWIQTKASAELRLHYWPQDNPDERKSSDIKTTQRADGYAQTLLATDLTPGTQYEYSIEVNGTMVAFDYPTTFETIPFFRERMPPPDFTVALAGANYVNDAPFDPINRKPGGEYAIYETILAQQPNLMIWVGNTIHLRASDWNSYSGYLSRYTKSRSVPELQPLLARVHHTAIWSTHDYHRPGADRYTWNKQDAQRAFATFWPNPSYGVADITGIATTLRWSDVDFFLLDDRTHRDLSHRLENKKQILGQAQIKWLTEMLKRSQASFKIVVVGSPVLNPEKSPLHMTEADIERTQLLDALKVNELGKVIFISGGKPFGELTSMVRAGSPNLYELTLGALTARPAEDTSELNYFRVPGTITFQRHFSTMQFHGPEDNRAVTIRAFDSKGKALWAETIFSNDLSW